MALKIVLPPGFVDRDGKIRFDRMEAIELHAGDQPPSYITWDAHLTAAFTQFDKLLDLLFMLSETAPSAFGLDKFGVAESGRALRLRLLRTLAKMVARTTTREAMTQGTVQRLREHRIELAQVSAHNAADFCIYYENVIVCIGDEPHPVYPPISAIGGGPPFHPRCVHVLTPFVERLATEEEKKAGRVSLEVLGRSPMALQRAYRDKTVMPRSVQTPAKYD